MIRIPAVDDHPLLLKGIRLMVSTEADMQIVAEASDGAKPCKSSARIGTT